MVADLTTKPPNSAVDGKVETGGGMGSGDGADRPQRPNSSHHPANDIVRRSKRLGDDARIAS